MMDPDAVGVEFNGLRIVGDQMELARNTAELKRGPGEENVNGYDDGELHDYSSLTRGRLT